MALKISTATANGALNGTGVKEQMTLGFLYLFAGTVPASADVALNMSTTHTEVVKISNNATATGLTFDNPAGSILSKAAAETWSGTVNITGFEGSLTSITPTFYRFCAAGDNGQGTANSSTGYRVQGTVGGPSSGADLELASVPIADGYIQPVGTFEWELVGA